MADFKDLFNVGDLDDQALGDLEWVVNSPAYKRIFEPYLEAMRDTLLHRLKDPSKERSEKYPGDFLRGGILMIEGLLILLNRIVAETRAERVSRASGVGMSQEELFERLRQTGDVKPAGTITPAEERYDPKEDI